MRWLLSGCFLGALGALLKHWQWPFSIWMTLAGMAVLLLGLFSWLNSSGIKSTNSDTSGAASYAGDTWGSSGSDQGFDSCDSGGGDGGCGGD